MGDEADADWQAGLVEWGREDNELAMRRPRKRRKRRQQRATDLERLDGMLDDRDREH